MPRKPRYRWALLPAVVAGAAFCAFLGNTPPAPLHRARSSVVTPGVTPIESVPLAPGRSLQAPSDTPARLSCDQATLVAMQARDLLAQPPPPVDPRAFAESTLDWLDPHGLWSAPRQAPVRAALQRQASSLLATLEQPGNDAGCNASHHLGVILRAWVGELRDLFDQQQQRAARATTSLTLAWSASSEPVFETGEVLRPAHLLAADLGQRAGAFAAAWGQPAPFVASIARKRMFPDLDVAAWGEVILAAAVRSYLLLIDPHGAWAPFDEETSLYEVELEATGRHRLWSRMSRTAVGVRVEEDPLEPLMTDDVVIAIDNIATAGLSVEQVEQLAVIDPADAAPERLVTILRGKGTLPQTLPVASKLTPNQQTDDSPPLGVQRVGYRDGDVLVLRIEDVPDDLGEQLAETLSVVRAQRDALGVLLDLRGNGGGSIDGAREAIALFMPGMPLFPMRRRDGDVEVEVAPIPPPEDLWKGPVAVLVDAETASAAEMIAGALGAYDRAIVIGERTFGKGCAQEYMDDDAGVGVLRLSTLVYALPDGSPVQRAGLAPDIVLQLGGTAEREDSIAHAMKPWRGPDIRRVPSLFIPWPPHAGRINGCRDEVVCRALRAVGMNRMASVRTAQR